MWILAIHLAYALLLSYEAWFSFLPGRNLRYTLTDWDLLPPATRAAYWLHLHAFHAWVLVVVADLLLLVAVLRQRRGMPLRAYVVSSAALQVLVAMALLLPAVFLSTQGRIWTHVTGHGGTSVRFRINDIIDAAACLLLAVAGFLLVSGLVAARHIVRRHQLLAPRCRRCGYDLHAATASRCPECGAEGGAI